MAERISGSSFHRHGCSCFFFVPFLWFSSRYIVKVRSTYVDAIILVLISVCSAIFTSIVCSFVSLLMLYARYPGPEPVEGVRDLGLAMYGAAFMVVGGVVFMLTFVVSFIVAISGTISIVYEITRRPDV